jgi:PAS domain S-box-containing protein
MLDSIPDAMIVIDGNGVMQSFSTTAERLFGYTAAEAVGQTVGMLMPSPYREQHDAYLGRYFATGEKRVIGRGRIVVGMRKDGSTFPMELAVGEVVSGGNHSFTGFVRDLTERQATQQRLQDMQAELIHMSRFTAMGEMASTLARELTISTVGQRDIAEICISDTGPGISPEVAAQLFNPFVTTKPNGMGVGLSISRTIVKAHGGRLWAEPNPGGGTIFRLTLKALSTEELANGV